MRLSLEHRLRTYHLIRKVLNNSTALSVYNLSGKNIANMSFDMPASKVIPIGTRGEYVLISAKYIQNIKLK